MDGTVDWKSPNGDRVGAYGAVPYISLTLGKSKFSGRANSFDAFEASIQDGHSGSSSVASDISGRFSGKFVNAHGRGIKVAPGDHFTAPGLATDADWIVPNIAATANPTNDKVHGTCEDTGSAWVSSESMCCVPAGDAEARLSVLTRTATSRSTLVAAPTRDQANQHQERRHDCRRLHDGVRRLGIKLVPGRLTSPAGNISTGMN